VHRDAYYRVIANRKSQIANRKLVLLIGLLLALGRAFGAELEPLWREYFNTGLAYYQQGDFAAAASQFRLAQAVCGEREKGAWRAAIRRWLGQAYYAQKLFPQALAELEAAAELDPGRATTHLWLGYVYACDQRPSFAVKHLRYVWLHPEATSAEKESAREWLTQLHESPALARWEPPLEAESDFFLVRHYGDPESVTAILEALETGHRFIRDALGVEVPDQTEVLVFPEAEQYYDYHARRGLPRPEWSTACAINGRIFTYHLDSPGALQTVVHEYTHVALRFAAGDRRLPCWLDEGLATWISGQQPEARALVEQAFQQQALLSIEELTVPSFGIYQGDRAQIAYAQAKSMAETFVARFGKEALSRILRALAVGQGENEAFREGTGLTPRQYLWAWMREMVRGR